MTPFLLQQETGGTESPGAGVSGTCEPFDIGAGNPTPVFWKNKEAHAIKTPESSLKLLSYLLQCLEPLKNKLSAGRGDYQ